MEDTLIKFRRFWRKIIRKDGCKGLSESAHTLKLEEKDGGSAY